MRKRLQKNFSIYEEDLMALYTLEKETGLTASEILRQTIRNLTQDEIHRQFFLKNFLKDEGEEISKRKLLRIMSILKMEKAGPGQAGQSRGNEAFTNVNMPGEINQHLSIERMIQIAKVNLYDE